MLLSGTIYLTVNELEKYFRWNHGVYQPKMEPVQVLSALDMVGQPQKPVYEFGPVLATGREKSLLSKKNHTQYQWDGIL